MAVEVERSGWSQVAFCLFAFYFFSFGCARSYGIPQWLSRKESAMQETQETRVRSLGWEDPLEEEMAIQSSILSWEIPWTEEAGRLLSIGSQRV